MPGSTYVVNGWANRRVDRRTETLVHITHFVQAARQNQVWSVITNQNSEHFYTEQCFKLCCIITLSEFYSISEFLNEFFNLYKPCQIFNLATYFNLFPFHIMQNYFTVKQLIISQFSQLSVAGRIWVMIVAYHRCSFGINWRFSTLSLSNRFCRVFFILCLFFADSLLLMCLIN